MAGTLYWISVYRTSKGHEYNGFCPAFTDT
jgi:hypothetical protein